MTLKFQDLFVKNRISELKCFGIKTSKPWTRKLNRNYHADVIIGQKSMQQNNNNDKRFFRKNRKAIEQQGQQPEPQIEIQCQQPVQEESVELALPRIDDALHKTSGQKSKIKFVTNLQQQHIKKKLY